MKPPDLPPVLPNIQNLLTEEYLLCPENLPIHNYERNQEFWSREPQIRELFNYEGEDCGTTLKVQRDFVSGKITELREVSVEVGLNAKNSMSLSRAPGPPVEGVRGDPRNFPFWPGGIPDPILQLPVEHLDAKFSDLLTVPPGFTVGVTFQDDGFTVAPDDPHPENERKKLQIANDSEDTVNLMNLVQQEQTFLDLWKEKENKIILEKEQKLKNKLNVNVDISEVISETEIPVLQISQVDQTNQILKSTEWAELIDIQQSVDDFHERVPVMAHTWKFDLDPFQKQAIIKLEESCDVFVAAHTSAGKTVVAEYAIALSQKHKTVTIYTSPIKALSNQKYREFKKTFQNVGLITGDFQINQTGICLIMTTEILRSMLYCGSEVIRDLEYVIFDEVHYINDTERGHVWEEVLILLPDHVRIVLLSATVPNTLEFASWLGQTKKRKVYVITTLRRPVPLRHYLYTGNGGKSRDNRFLILDGRNNFIMQGLIDAKTSLESLSKNANKNFLPQKDKMRQESTALVGLIDHLKRNDLLPVVAFTFSRAMCDKMAACLKSTDLTTGEEKSRIHKFYMRCIKLLKDPDKNLPQVLRMQQLLKNGIGVHHSGILPIIKEIVEMLFQDGLVKVLFATETFAMGVNMPARTVVFNSLVKWDGIEKRYLKPAEYIQMAGRAGRRNLDTNGTVIIRSSDVPDIRILKEIMLGKPEKLESKFRLTYSMLLSLFRAESFSVESMMSHSFCEINHVSKADELKIELECTQKELEMASCTEISEHLQQMLDFYKAVSEYLSVWKNLQPKLLNHPRFVKEMVPGRILLISYMTHSKKLGILLSAKKQSGNNNVQYKVLVLCNQNEKMKNETSKNKPEEWYRIMNTIKEDIFQLEGAADHTILEVSVIDLMLTNKIVKIDYDLVIKDWDKRQIDRFKNDPPGHTCQLAVQELIKLTTNFKKEDLNTDIYSRINDIELHLEYNYLTSKEKAFKSQMSCLKIANFEEQFFNVFRRKYLEEKLDNLKFKLSSRSLSLYPDYLSRTEILKQLRYIDDECRVNMKGRVACEIGMNELLITELVFRNTLTNLQPAEVAALLSALVFQVKVTKDQQLPELSENLMNGMKEINDIHFEIKNLEANYNVSTMQEDLNFGLVEVVYEWANQKPFAEIMALTDVQEGITVRCIQQLNETLKDVREVAGIIGDPVLKTKMEETSTIIKRDIVFVPSLYTQRETPNV